MSAHTPLPWITQSATAHPPTTHIVSDSGNHIASVPRLANAELIVRAVNHHAALVDALADLLALAEAMRDTIANEPGLRALLDTKSPRMEQARAALALATGENPPAK